MSVRRKIGLIGLRGKCSAPIVTGCDAAKGQSLLGRGIARKGTSERGLGGRMVGYGRVLLGFERSLETKRDQSCFVEAQGKKGRPKSRTCWRQSCNVDGATGGDGPGPLRLPLL